MQEGVHGQQKVHEQQVHEQEVWGQEVHGREVHVQEDLRQQARGQKTWPQFEAEGPLRPTGSGAHQAVHNRFSGKSHA